MTASCCFSGHPDHLADRGHQRLGLGEVRLVAVGAAGDRGHPLVDERGRVGHDPHDRDALGQPGLDERGGDAGGQRDHQLAGPAGRGDLVEHVAHVLRLDDEHQGVGAPRGLDVGDHARRRTAPAARRHARGASRRPAGRRRTAGAEQPGEQGLAHHAGADDRERAHAGLTSSRSGTCEECQVARALGETSHQVAVPLLRRRARRRAPSRRRRPAAAARRGGCRRASGTRRCPARGRCGWRSAPAISTIRGSWVANIG